MGQVRLPGVHDIGERPRSASIYEATIVPICGLISQIPADGFQAIELILLKHLLSNQLWSSLLSSDIWCFVDRFVNRISPIIRDIIMNIVFYNLSKIRLFILHFFFFFYKIYRDTDSDRLLNIYIS